MKLRFGIREKFTVMAIVLVLLAALVVPHMLFEQTKEVVIDHEITDLKDETFLRCWETTESVSNLRTLVVDIRRDEAVYDRLLYCARNHRDLGHGKEPRWWANIEAILRYKSGSGAFDLVWAAEGAEEAKPPSEFVQQVMGNTAPIVSPLVPLDLPLRPRWQSPLTSKGAPTQRMAGIWGARQGEPGKDTVFLLLSMATLYSPRHLAFLLNEEGNYLTLASPGSYGSKELNDPFQDKDLYDKLMENIPLQPSDVNASGFNLPAAFRAHGVSEVENLNWQGSESRDRIQRGVLLEKLQLEKPFFFLEGRATDAFRKSLQRQSQTPAERTRNTTWFADLQLKGKRSGWHVGGLQDGARELRLLSADEESLETARKDVEFELQQRFGADYDISWDEPVRCQQVDVQLVRFFLRQSDGKDHPYWFAYCVFRDELTASINHEMHELTVFSLWMSLGAGLLAFVLGFWMVTPLVGITRTAQSVAGSSEDALQNRIEAVRQSLPNHRKDEVGDISRALDRLLLEVLNGHERLRQSNADIQKTVDDRTRDLKAAYSQLEGLAAAKNTFIASVSHELRQPLNSIFGYAQTVEASSLTDQQRQDIEKLLRAAEYLEGLINDIIDFQKIIMNGLELEPEEIDVAPFFSDLHSSLEFQAKKRNNRLTFVGIEEAGPLRNDSQRLRQVLVNLLTNACKFTHDGEVTLAVRRQAASIAGQSDWLLIEVRDTGRGMTPEEMGDLFVQFKKLASREGNRGGSGLGLVISKGLCELMGGVITVTSEYGKGSVFTVRIPAQVQTAAETTGSSVLSSPAIPPPTAPMVTGAERTVLIIDDDASVRELVGRFLKQEGCTVFEAEDGDSGIKSAIEHQPHLITLDVVMPGRDGWETLTLLKSDPRTSAIPVALVSFIDQARKGYSLGATDYIIKPIDWQRLRHILRRHTVGEAPVLIVDDEPAARELARRNLEQDGWAVLEAANGAEACELLKQQTPAVIVLDLIMPVMDGFEFMTVLRSDPRWHSVPVIVVTAMELTPDERQRLNGSVTSILAKNDFSLETLLAEVLRCAQPPHTP